MNRLLLVTPCDLKLKSFFLHHLKEYRRRNKTKFMMVSLPESQLRQRIYYINLKRPFL